MAKNFIISRGPIRLFVFMNNGVLTCLQGSDTQVVEIQDFPKPNLGPDIFLGKGIDFI